MKKGFLILLSALLVYGCDMIEYHPYDGRIKGEKNINEKNINRIQQACKGKKSIRFAFIGDTQREYDETEKFVKHLNKRNDIDFVIHGGDVSDFGLTKEFIWMRDIMNKLNVPYVVLLGNHDCLANGEEVFSEIFGRVNYSFIAGDIKFVCLNTNALEFDYSHPIPDFDFIENERTSSSEKFQKTVVAMHVRPYSDQFNNNVAKWFQASIKEFPNLQFCINAHDHGLRINDLFNDGIIYYGVPDIKKKQYFIFTINADDTYAYELVEF